MIHHLIERWTEKENEHFLPPHFICSILNLIIYFSLSLSFLTAQNIVIIHSKTTEDILNEVTDFLDDVSFQDPSQRCAGLELILVSGENSSGFKSVDEAWCLSCSTLMREGWWCGGDLLRRIEKGREGDDGWEGSSDRLKMMELPASFQCKRYINQKLHWQLWQHLE